jgi:hypothetical protein
MFLRHDGRRNPQKCVREVVPLRVSTPRRVEDHDVRSRGLALYNKKVRLIATMGA